MKNRLFVFFISLLTVFAAVCSEKDNNTQTTQNRINSNSGIFGRFLGHGNTGPIPENVRNGSDQDKIDYLLNQQDTVQKLNEQIETLHKRVNELKTQSNSSPGFTDMLRIAALIKEIPGIVDGILKTTGNNSDVALKWAKNIQEGLLKDTDKYLDAIFKVTANNSDIAFKWSNDFLNGVFNGSDKHSDEVKAIMQKLSAEFIKEFEEVSTTFMNEKGKFFETSTQEVNTFMTMIGTKYQEFITRLLEDHERDEYGGIRIDNRGNPIRITPLATLGKTLGKNTLGSRQD